MRAKRLSVSDLRLNIRDVLEGAKFRSELFVIMTYGRPMAVVVGVEEWERLSGGPLVTDGAAGGEGESE